MSQDGDVVRLQSPDKGLQVGIVDVVAADSSAAVDLAWTLWAPTFAHGHSSPVGRPARVGWDERARFFYEFPETEHRFATALANRRGDTWTVLVVAGDKAEFDRRTAQAYLAMETLRGPGYAPEDFSNKSVRKLDDAALKELTEFVERARRASRVPGVALGIVEGSRVVFEGGFGTREVDKPRPVDAHTPFLIASNTKSLTTMLFAKLVDEGKFTWTTPVTSVYPQFKLADEGATQKIEMKDLVCACTGLPRQDLELYFDFKNKPASTVFGLLQRVKPTTEFGAVYQYSNILAAAGGYVAASSAFPRKEVGAAYDEAMGTRLFAPLGMSETTFDIDAALRRGAAMPHDRTIDGTVVTAGLDFDRNVFRTRPAGGAWSTVHDLDRYVQLELARGVVPDGKRLIEEKSVVARWEPQVSSGANRSYGMGLETEQVAGVRVIQHGGAMTGYESRVFFLPEQNIGVVLLTNSTSGWMLARAIRRKLFEVLYDAHAEAEEDLMGWAAAEEAGTKANRAALIVPPDAEARSNLATHYQNDVLGRIDVHQSADAVVFDFGEWKSAIAMKRSKDGAVVLVTIDAGSGGWAFELDSTSHALHIRDAQHEYVFAPTP